MPDFELPDAIRDQTRAAWHRYLDLLIPFRPQLHRYCRRLTGDRWDTEDLVQETLLRGFGQLGSTHGTIENPRGYLVRVATHLWIDTVRRRGAESAALAEAPHDAPPSATDPGEVRDASAALMRLTPQERAAVLLKDVFDMRLEEIAETLATTVGAVKAALHRGRTRLREPAPATPPRRGPSAALVDRFVALLNASDLPGLLALMLDSASVEELGSLVEVGRREFERVGSWLWHAVHVHADLPAEMRPSKFVNQRAIVDGEAMMLSFAAAGEQQYLAAVTRFEEIDGRIARLRAYNFCPELLQELGPALGIAPAVVPYRFPTVSSGA